MQIIVILVAEGWQTHERVEKDEFALKFLEFGITTEDVRRDRLILAQDLNNVDLQKNLRVLRFNNNRAITNHPQLNNQAIKYPKQ